MFTFLIWMLAAGCASESRDGGSPSQPGTSSFEVVSRGQVPESETAEVRGSIEEAIPRVLADLGVTELPPITVYVWGDADGFAQEYGEDATGVRGFISSENWEVHALYSGQPVWRSVLHEYTHLVSLARNPQILGNARWLWETVAIFESNRPPRPDESTLACISRTHVPSLDELSEHPSNIYRVGHLLGEFIVQTWSREALGTLIATTGDTFASFGISPHQFEQMWLAYLLENHDINESTVGSVENC